LTPQRRRGVLPGLVERRYFTRCDGVFGLDVDVDAQGKLDVRRRPAGVPNHVVVQLDERLSHELDRARRVVGDGDDVDIVDIARLDHLKDDVSRIVAVQIRHWGGFAARQGPGPEGLVSLTTGVDSTRVEP